MGRDTEKIDDETNGEEKEVKTQFVTENQMINLKLDTIIKLLLNKDKD